MRKTDLIIASAMLLLSLPAFAKDLGTVGKTYPIAETDALSELEDRARRIDTKKMLAKAQPEKYRPGNLKNLPRASKTRSYQVDMTYTVQEDIPDGKGGVLYPQGYTFNPLTYMPFKKTLVVIDGNDRQQVEWFAGSQYKSDPSVMLLLTDGASGDVQKRVRRPVFYATEPIVSRFRLSAVPSIIRAKGLNMEVEEIAVPLKRSANGG
jgi:conjugal transfer pilus assembly protein TraW